MKKNTFKIGLLLGALITLMLLFTEGAMAAPTTGSAKGITILIDFPDEVGTFSRQEVDNLLNQPGYSLNGNNGSVRDYFYDVSEGKFEYTNTVTEYYRAKNNKSYYTSCTDYSKAKELALEALQYIESSGFDFSKVDYLNFMYAGFSNSVMAQGLWAHRGDLSIPFTADGKTFTRYQMTHMGTELRIGTFIHENGHLIFDWRDLYDSNGGSYGISDYCLMGGGAIYNPLPPNPYFRMLAGWANPIVLNDIQDGSLLSAKANSNDIYMYKTKNPKEFFIIENVQRTGRRTYMGDEGLLIWHIDEDKFNNSQQEMTPTLHYKVSLEQADGLFELERNLRNGGPGDAFHADGNNRFDNTTLPNSNLWSGEESGLSIYDIGAKGSEMTFKYKYEKASDPAVIAEPKELLADNFESTDAITANWTNNGVEAYNMFVIFPYNGQYVSGFDSGESITKTISTKGYKNIVIRYAASGRSDGDADDTIILEWNDGTSSTWNVLKVDREDDVTWIPNSISLPVEAENMDAIKIRFRAGNLEESEQVFLDDLTITGMSLDTTVPEAPTNFQSIASTDTSIELSWTASTDNVGVVGYDIYDVTNGAYTKINTSLITGTSYKVTGLTPDTLYRYIIKAVDATGNISESSMFSAKTKAFKVNTLLIVDNATTMTAADTKIKNRLISLGYDVTVKSALTAATTDATGMGLVVMTSTNYSYNLSTKFKNVTIPVIVMEPSLYDDMGMTGTLLGTDNGNSYIQTKVTMANSTHPMASGLTGTVTTTSVGATYNWGKPAASADVITNIYLNTGKAAIFVYDKGDAMIGITAPSKRIGFLLDATTADNLTAEGWKLFDAAVNYAVNN